MNAAYPVQIELQRHFLWIEPRGPLDVAKGGISVYGGKQIEPPGAYWFPRVVKDEDRQLACHNLHSVPDLEREVIPELLREPPDSLLLVLLYLLVERSAPCRGPPEDILGDISIVIKPVKP